jgi:hypothetical protein
MACIMGKRDGLSVQTALLRNLRLMISAEIALFICEVYFANISRNMNYTAGGLHFRAGRFSPGDFYFFSYISLLYVNALTVCELQKVVNYFYHRNISLFWVLLCR